MTTLTRRRATTARSELKSAATVASAVLEAAAAAEVDHLVNGPTSTVRTPIMLCKRELK